MYEMKILDVMSAIKIARRKCDKNFDRDEIAELDTFMREVKSLYSEFIAHGWKNEKKLDGIMDAI